MRYLPLLLLCACAWSPTSLPESAIRIDTPTGQGSGAVTDCGVIDGEWWAEVVTAAHVAIHTPRYRFARKGADLAYMYSRAAGPMPALERADYHPVPGQRVYCAGYPLGDKLVLFEGLVGETDENGAWCSIPGSPGMSGSPIVDEDGRLLGVLTDVKMMDPHHFLPTQSYFVFVAP